MALDLTSFEKAVRSLQEVIERYKNEENDDAVKDSVIKRFEYCYEMSHRILRRFLELNLPSSEDWSFNNLIRTGNENGLLKSNLEKWALFRSRRNITSHTYDGNKAKEVINIVPDFYEEAVYLLQELKRRIKNIK